MLAGVEQCAADGAIPAGFLAVADVAIAHPAVYSLVFLPREYTYVDLGNFDRVSDRAARSTAAKASFTALWPIMLPPPLRSGHSVLLVGALRWRGCVGYAPCPLARGLVGVSLLRKCSWV